MFVWNVQYKLGMWKCLDSYSDGFQVLALVNEYVPNARILDLGCGTSANLPLHAGICKHYHGVDISEQAIKEARALARPNTSYEAADILTYCTDQIYDAILLREVLYYFESKEINELLHRVSSFLAPDGKVFIQLYDVSKIKDGIDVVRNCGLAVLEERPRQQESGSVGLFMVLTPSVS
jgi:trans-aconitate methyltransferase